MTYKNNLYSKLATNPLWSDILSGLLVHASADKYTLNKAWPDLRPKSKLSLYSAHDTTIMTLLASLGGNLYDNSWPPYASMLNIELFDIEWDANTPDEIRRNFPTNLGFRLLYNGKAITEHVSGCMRDEEICDLDLLVLHVYPFSNVTEWDELCKKQNSDTGKGDDSNSSHLDVGQNILTLLLGGLLCGFFGAFISFMYLSKSPTRFSKVPHQQELNSLALETENGGKLYGLQPNSGDEGTRGII